MRAVERVTKKCGGTRLHRHRQWSGRVDRCRGVSPEAPEDPRLHPDQRPRAALRQAAAQQGLPLRPGPQTRPAQPRLVRPAGHPAAPRHHRRAHRPRQPRSRHRGQAGATPTGIWCWPPARHRFRSPFPAERPRCPCVRSPTPSSCGWPPRTPTRPSWSGGGLIGCEAASCLATRGVATTLVAPEPVPVHAQVRRRGRRTRREDVVRHRCSLHRFDERDRRRGPRSHPGHRCRGGGGTRRLRHRRATRQPARDGGGHSTPKNGRIVVDERMHTSTLNVYAAGDVALAYNVTAGRRIPSEHWRDATQQGRVAGTVAAGYPATWT